MLTLCRNVMFVTSSCCALKLLWVGKGSSQGAAMKAVRKALLINSFINSFKSVLNRKVPPDCLIVDSRGLWVPFLVQAPNNFA